MATSRTSRNKTSRKVVNKPASSPLEPRTRKRTMTRALKLPPSTLTAAFNHIEPSWRNYLDYVRISAREGDEDMKRFVDVYDQLNRREAQTMTPEQLCEKANVQPEDLVAEVVRQLWRTKNFEAGVITAVNHPKIIAKTAKSALGSGKSAQFDRTNFLKGTGFLPQPKPALFAKEVNLPAIGQGNGDGEKLRLRSQEEQMKLLDAVDGPGADGAIEAEEVRRDALTP